jgi:hypothetical protein
MLHPSFLEPYQTLGINAIMIPSFMINEKTNIQQIKTNINFKGKIEASLSKGGLKRRKKEVAIQIKENYTEKRSCS